MNMNYSTLKERKEFLHVSGHDYILWKENSKIILEFWKSRPYDNYECLFSIHVEDMEKIAKAMEHCERLLEKDLPANMILKYCLVPEHYMDSYYYMESFCNHLIIGRSENDLKDSRKKLWLPINSKLIRERLLHKPKIYNLDFRLTVNGKEINEPLSHETAKRLGIIE